MPLAIETVIIVVTVVSFTLLGVIAFALYWLWRLFLEDRRCSRFESVPRRTSRSTTLCYTSVVAATSANETSHRISWRIPKVLEGADNAPLTSPNAAPRIIRQSEAIVDERKRRMIRIKTHTSSTQLVNGNCTGFRSSNSRTYSGGLPSTSEIIVIDGTEPPPPYEAVR